MQPEALVTSRARRWLAMGFVVVLVIGGLWPVGCGTEEKPSSSQPAVSTSQPAVSTSQPVVPTRQPVVPTSGTQKPRIVLYENVVAGDYRILRILTSGRTEFTGYQGVNQITMRRQGDLDPDSVTQLLGLIQEKGFFQLDSEYDIYPLAPDDTKVYEDRYFWVRVSIEGWPEKTVVAHEKATPPDLEEIIATLIDILPQIPDSSVSGSFILAGDYEILRHKRPVEDELVLQLNSESQKQYPLLEKALNDPFSLVPVETLEGTKLGEVFRGGRNSLEVRVEGKRFAVLLLTREVSPTG